MRLYRSGTRWCVWRWTITDSQYITRLHLIKTPLFAICLHWLNKPDPEPYLHDHPVSFLSLILRGGYTELRETGQAPCFPGDADSAVSGKKVHRWFNFVRASFDDRHTIIDVKPRTLTLALMGPKVRDWGFHIRGRWEPWKAYYRAQRAGVQL